MSSRGRSPTLQQLLNYWENRAPSYYIEDPFGRAILKAFIEKLQPQSLIEIGCGNGELFSLYKHIPISVGIDWSEEMLIRANLRKGRHYLPNLRLWRHDITQCSPQGNYDVVVTRTVLMHIPPEAIEKTIRHIVKVGERFLIFEYFETIPTEKLAAHNWLHDYVPLFEKAGCELIESYTRPDLPQVLFQFQKKKSIDIPGVQENAKEA
ncbi:MAG: class I SAM-dependent methyltransferase [Candidatus Bipolaricaulis sp.]|nr:class I SAM-dependent methyltransferase [Candidatus Bipolaricaulis sp.]